MSHVATICPHCQTENHHHGADCVKCNGSLAQAPGSDSRPRDARQMRVIETLMDGAKAAHDSGDLELHTEYCVAIGDLLVLWENTNPNDGAEQRRA